MGDVSIYTSKDGRTRVYIKETKRVVSYPRYLLEKHLGRTLRWNEQVHHKDGNPLNNDLDNLEIKLLGQHQKEHHPCKYFDKIETCSWCGRSFLWTAKQQVNFYGNCNRKNRVKLDKPFCSKKCTGEYGKSIQNHNGRVAK